MRVKYEGPNGLIDRVTEIENLLEEINLRFKEIDFLKSQIEEFDIQSITENLNDKVGRDELSDFIDEHETVKDTLLILNEKVDAKDIEKLLEIID